MRPDLDDLIGTDIEPGERARLEGVHELLVAAGPPPEAPRTRPVELPRRRRRGALLAIAAALAESLRSRWAPPFVDSGHSVDFVVPMAATAAVPASASASLTVFRRRRCRQLADGLSVEGLSLRANGRRTLAHARGQARGSVRPLPHVRPAPRRADERAVPFRRFDGWVVVEEGSTTPLLTT